LMYYYLRRKGARAVRESWYKRWLHGLTIFRSPNFPVVNVRID